MNKSVLFIFVAFIVVSSFIRFLSVDHFDTDNVSIVANSILSSRLDRAVEPEPVPEPQLPCDELSCYMSMLSYHNQQRDFNNLIEFPESCRNCPEIKNSSEFTPIAGVTDVHTPYDWSKHDTPDSVKYPGNSTDNYANYCNWGLAHSWCSIPEFSNACRNECPSS